MRTPKGFVLSLISIVAILPLSSRSAEVDNYRIPPGFMDPVNERAHAVNERVNERIRYAIAAWSKGRRNLAPTRENRVELTEKIYGILDWSILYGRVSEWIERNPEIPKNGPEETIYRNMDFWDGPVLMLYGSVPSVLVAGVPVGLDKFAHFFDAGFVYYKRVVKHGIAESKVLEFGTTTESGAFGWYSTGVYSNGDLVANYEGYLFFRGLTEDGVVAGKPAMIRWTEKGPILQREFDVADHVNSYWNEAMNPSHFREGLSEGVRIELRALCGRYAEAPALYTPVDGDALRERYAHIGLIESLDFRMDRVCAAE